MTRSDLNAVIQALQAAETMAECAFQRRLVVFSGSIHWVDRVVCAGLNALPEKPTLFVTNRELTNGVNNFTGQPIQAERLSAYLGSETERLIWDGFSGLHPDGLGAASGLLKGGGLLILMLPTFETLQRHPDPDYLRMCASPEQLQSCGTRFLQRMIQLLKLDSDIQVFCEEAVIERPEQQRQATPPISLDNSVHPTADQRSVIEAIVNTANGPSKRPLVIQADRGRGKSSALGIAAAKLVADHATPIILVTAPTRLACAPVFTHFERELDTHETNSKVQTNLRFIAPDELLATLPVCNLLLVDEAAAIPASLLKAMLEHYPRVIFATTIHGYEGTGQGFALRFSKVLDQLTPAWRSMTLVQPVRWSAGDPLERWIAELLMLNADFAELSRGERQHYLSAPVQWLAQQTLADRPELLTQVIGLLVLAHYQTAPSDIRLILDHPAIRLGLVEVQGRVVAVILLLREGSDSDANLASGLIQGVRRPRGHLVPQALTSACALPELLALSSYRVMRITVHPELINQGLGSRLLNAAVDLTRTEGLDYISASFGCTQELMAFWTKNRLQLMRLGYHQDAASGTHAAMMVRALSAQAEPLIQQCRADFQRHFLFGFSRFFRTLDWPTVLTTVQALNMSMLALNDLDRTKIAAFAKHFRSFEDSAVSLHDFILTCIANHAFERLQTLQQGLLISKVLQGRSWSSTVNMFNLTGKKAAEQKLRQAIAELLEV